MKLWQRTGSFFLQTKSNRFVCYHHYHHQSIKSIQIEYVSVCVLDIYEQNSFHFYGLIVIS